jgi:hypothetical protein
MDDDHRLVILLSLLAMLFGALACATPGAVQTAVAIPGKGTVTAKPGLFRALEAVWACYGRKDAPPRVRIVEGEDLDCVSPISGKRGFGVLLPDDERLIGQPDVDCREGFTYSDDEVMVSWHGETQWSETTLAHELQHAMQARNWVIDPHHRRPEWQPGGEVDRCNAELAAVEP